MWLTLRCRPASEAGGRRDNRWVLGARPRTLPASAVPVVVGTAVAAAEGTSSGGGRRRRWSWPWPCRSATNYANDYSDGIRGTDEARVGPVRLVASGLASPKAVKRAARGLRRGRGGRPGPGRGGRLVAAGRRACACMAAGWLYTGGPRPYGYAGLGELFVFVFFGLVATVGTAYVQLEPHDRVGGGGRRPGRACWPSPCWSSTTCGTSRRRRERQADPGRAHRRAGHPAAVYAGCVVVPFGLSAAPSR